MQEKRDRVTVAATQGRLVTFGGIGARFKVRGEDTGGMLAIIEQPVQPGAMAPPHTHTREDEYSYVLEGNLWARVGDQDIEATPGTWILKPRNVPHTFWNPGPGVVRFIEVITPAGLEGLFEELAELFQRGRPRPEELAGLAERYGCPLTNPEWIPELVERYRLTPLGAPGGATSSRRTGARAL